MADSTSIEALPAPGGGNVKLGITEQTPVQMPQQSMPTLVPNSVQNSGIQGATNSPPTMAFAPATMDPNSLTKVINGIQRAEAQGMTRLPSRDVPMNSAAIVQDEQARTNYLAKSEQTKYIEEEDSYNSMLEKNRNKQSQQDRLDVFYDEFQVPILIMVLFFIFQLPFVQKKLMAFFPTLFLKDGHMSMGGYVTKTMLFGVTFYAIMKLTNYASEL